MPISAEYEHKQENSLYCFCFTGAMFFSTRMDFSAGFGTGVRINLSALSPNALINKAFELLGKLFCQFSASAVADLFTVEADNPDNILCGYCDEKLIRTGCLPG